MTAPLASSNASARGIGYRLAAGVHQPTAPGGAGARSASVRVALDRLPRTAQTVLDRNVWRGKELLLGAPTASVLHAFGACRAAQHTAKARADAHRLQRLSQRQVKHSRRPTRTLEPPRR
jgi:hypothetical protein